jgi:hypothetical protein
MPAAPEDGQAAFAKREIADGLKYLSDDDLGAIADYLLAQRPIMHEVTSRH